MKKSVKSFACLWSPWHCECSYEKLGVNGLREPVELAKSAPTASHFKAKFHCSPTYSVVTWAFFWVSPGISNHDVLYTAISGFSRRTIVRSGHLRACPCWFIAKFGELQHQRIFSNGRAPKWPERTFVLLKICDFWVYNTPRVDIPGETQKIQVVLQQDSLVKKPPVS